MIIKPSVGVSLGNPGGSSSAVFGAPTEAFKESNNSEPTRPLMVHISLLSQFVKGNSECFVLHAAMRQLGCQSMFPAHVTCVSA